MTELTPEMGGLARSATRLVNDVLNLAITFGFKVVEAWGLTGRTGFKVNPNHGWPENSPRLAACRIIVLAQNQDHELLHAMSAVAARQLIGSVADARRKSA